MLREVNALLNAGHSPQQIARQMVRYLRNALMAKMGGEPTELLQISADERARAARTALLVQRRRPHALPANHAAHV